MNTRRLRSAVKSAGPQQPTFKPAPVSPVTFVSPSEAHSLCNIQKHNRRLPGLSKLESDLLRRKQQKLEIELPATWATLNDSPQHFQVSLASTLIFAQEPAGTAVCISASGLVLTCAHCIAEDKDEYEEFDTTWLLFCTGQAVQAKCLAWDPKRDLALLQIVRAEIREPPSSDLTPKFFSLPIAHNPPLLSQEIYCIGQPGRDDLESKRNRKTTYNLIEISHGNFRGNVSGSDMQDNSDIGNLKHDAWTYWGHSGAPLISSTVGEVIGLHSSWDDRTGMRHGIPIAAIHEFLGICADSEDQSMRDEILDIIQRQPAPGIGSSISNAIVIEDTLLEV